MDLSSIIRSASRPLLPQPTTRQAQLLELPDIRAVCFDIYGTLIISASGDISLASAMSQGSAFLAAIRSVGGEFTADPNHGSACLLTHIAAQQAHLRSLGHPKPEVEIRDCWRSCLDELRQTGSLIGPVPDDQALAALAVHYECATNPVWPMPHALACLDQLRSNGHTLGIISNAQFYTPHLFPALLNRDLDTLGFDTELRWYSFEHGRAKPDTWMYERCAAAFATRGIAAQQVLYIGNDMLNDMLPAHQVGFRTALFAGDARSLRERHDHPAASALSPDLVCTDLAQVPACLGQPLADPR